MKPIRLIRRGINLQRGAIKKTVAGPLRLQSESLAYLGDDPDAAVEEDERLAVPYVFAGYLGVAAELLKAALEDLEKIKDATQETAKGIVEQLRAESDDTGV